MNTLALGLSPGHDEPIVSQSGPWGRLEYVPLRISPPLEFFEQFHLGDGPTVWRFPNLDLHQTAQLLAGFGVPLDAVQRLCATALLEPSTTGIDLLPDAELLRTLGPEARAGLYHWLGRTHPQSWHGSAFRHFGTSLDEWLNGEGISPATTEIVRPYVYRQGSYLMFADLPAVAAMIADSLELARLVKALARETTLLAQLHVRRGDNLEQLVAYWGRGGRQKNVRPLLESLLQLRGGQLIDIIHLLPPFARRKLYNYPRARDDGHDGHRDCHWTSLNFFNDMPDDRFVEMSAVAQTVSRDWQPTSDRPLFGDIAFFHDQQGSVFHSAVYIADDVLFTKNGATRTRPWVLMRLDQMAEFYPRSTPVDCRYFRRRDLV